MLKHIALQNPSAWISKTSAVGEIQRWLGVFVLFVLLVNVCLKNQSFFGGSRKNLQVITVKFDEKPF